MVENEIISLSEANEIISLAEKANEQLQICCF